MRFSNVFIPLSLAASSLSSLPGTEAETQRKTSSEPTIISERSVPSGSVDLDNAAFSLDDPFSYGPAINSQPTTTGKMVLKAGGDSQSGSSESQHGQLNFRFGIVP